MAAGTIGVHDRRVARRATPRRRPAKADRLGLDAARVVVIGVLVTLGLIGLSGVGAMFAAAAPPVGGPVPGYGL